MTNSSSVSSRISVFCRIFNRFRYGSCELLEFSFINETNSLSRLSKNTFCARASKIGSLTRYCLTISFTSSLAPEYLMNLLKFDIALYRSLYSSDFASIFFKHSSSGSKTLRKKHFDCDSFFACFGFKSSCRFSDRKYLDIFFKMFFTFALGNTPIQSSTSGLAFPLRSARIQYS